MPLFRKKPVVIEAVQITEDSFDKPHPNPEHIPGLIYVPTSRTVVVPTLEGNMIASVGDWIITGVKGERYSCKDEIFRMTYEPVRPADEEQS